MGYNKRQFQKTNDKKVLHKVRKHWVVVSLAMLMALGGGAVATHTNVHADTTNNGNGTAGQVNQNASQSNSTLVSASAQSNNNQSAAQNNNTAAQSAQSNGAKQSAVSNQSIEDKAVALHQQILAGANHNANVQNNSGLSTKVGNTKKLLGSTLQSDIANNMADYHVNWYDYSDGNKLVHQSDQRYNAGSDFNVQQTLRNWETHFGKAVQTYEFNPGADSSNGYQTLDGIEFDGKRQLPPSKWAVGPHTLDIAVTKRPVQQGVIIVQYDNVNDNGASVNSKPQSDNPGSDFTNLNADENSVPTGYEFDSTYNKNGIISDGGLSINSTTGDTKFPNGTAVIKLAVKPISTGTNTENAVYVDESDGNVAVGQMPFTRDHNSKYIDRNIKNNLQAFAPVGYNVDSSNPFPSDDENLNTFTPGGNYYVNVKANGVTPSKPALPSDFGTATINYTVAPSDGNGNPYSDAGTVVYTEKLVNKGTTAFNPQNDQSSFKKIHFNGYKVDTGDSNWVSPTTYSTNPTQTIYVLPDKTAVAGSNGNVTYHVYYKDVKTGSDVLKNEPLNETAKAGSTIDYANYTSLMPANCSFVGLGSHGADAEQGANEVILVKKSNTTPGNVTVNYVNRHTGSDVSSQTIPGTGLNYGSDINVENFTDKSGQHYGLPYGYQLADSNEDTSVHVNSDNQDVQILVDGQVVNQTNTNTPGSTTKNATPQVTVVPLINYYDANGDLQQTSDTAAEKTKSFSDAKFGSDVQLSDLSTYKPSAAADGTNYVLEKGQSKALKVNGQGQVGDKGKAYVKFMKVSPVTVNFYNSKTGVKLTSDSYNYKPNLTNMAKNGSDSFDVTKGQSQNSDVLPKGYVAVSGQNNMFDALAGHTQTVNYAVQGKNVTVNYHIDRNTMDNGTPGSLTAINLSQPAQVGDQITMDPNAKGVKPAGYTTGPNDSKVVATVDPTGHIKNNGTTFTYDATSVVNHVTPIEIEYVNQAGSDVGHQIDPAMAYGDQIVANDPSQHGLKMPANYHLANPNENVTFTFDGDNSATLADGSKGQLAQVNVVGSDLPANSVHYGVIGYGMKNGKRNASKPRLNLVYNGQNGYPARVGDRIPVDIDDANPDTNAYSPTYSDAKEYLTVGKDNDGNITVTPSVTANSIDSNDPKSDLGLKYNVMQGYVTVSYKDGNTPVGSDQVVVGDIGSHFDMSKYENENNLPVGPEGQHYVFMSVNNPATNFTSTDQNPVIQLQKWDTATINYKDTTNNKIVGSAKYSAVDGSGNVPANYFDGHTLPSGYKTDGSYTGSENLFDGANYTVNVKPDQTHPSKQNSDVANYGTITVHYVPSKYNSLSYKYAPSILGAATTDTITTYGVSSSTVNGVTKPGTPFNIESYVPAGGVPDDSNYGTGVTSYQNGKNQDVYVFYDQPTSHPSTISNTIEYDDENNNDNQVGTLTLNGITGSNINYSDYENVVPQGYTFDQLGNHYQKLNVSGAIDHILVRKNVPNQTYGEIDVKYKDSDGHILSDSDDQYAPTGSNYEAVQAMNSVPANYQFKDIEGNVTSIPSIFPGPDTHANPDTDPTGGSHMTITVDVTKAPKPYTTYTVQYSNNGTVMPKATETVTGKTGSLFDYSSYEDDAPKGFQFSSVGSNMPTTFDGNSRTVTINVTPVSDD